MTAPGKDFSKAPAPRLFKKKVPDDEPVTPQSAVLFRFGEQCNNDCPMCSNTGDASLFFHPTETLLRRPAFLHRSGFRRAVVTGGEPTIHPGFWTVVERLEADGFTWDVNTHGRSFAKDGFARRAAEHGLKRAIVSLHSHRPATSAALFGTREDAHHETVAGIDRLLDADVEVTVNCVLTRLNLGELEEYLRAGRGRYGVDELVPFTARRTRPAKTRANSFNFVRTATAVPWTAEADACTAHAGSGGLDPVRHLWLTEDGRLTLYVTDTGDFTAAELAR